ncbi:MAG: TenA family transcriptional regulator [Lachnospiraceae bacterium]
MEEIALDTQPIWEQCLQVGFIKEMCNDTLSQEKFLNYIIQDSLYLRDYIRVHAMAVFKSRTLKEMKVFASVLGYVNDSENATRLKYLSDNNLTDDDIENFEKNHVCKAYTDFLFDYAVNQDIPEILMAFIPCMIGYYEVFRLVLKQYPQIMTSYYKEFVCDYTTNEYKKSCDEWIAFANVICESLDDERKNNLKKIYTQSSMYELEFWKM